MLTDTTDVELVQFMLESNRIEGEKGINPGDLQAARFVLSGIDTIDDLLMLHNIVGKHLKKDWVGKFRTCQVTVGGYIPPKPEHVTLQIEDLMEDVYKLNSWELHNKFEAIHPFQDLNGRVGRLLWLSKAINEGYDFSISFLHKYYYQTLSNTPK